MAKKLIIASNALSKYLGLKLTYALNTDDKIELKNELNEQDLRNLPIEILTELRDAVELLDDNRATDAIAKIKKIR